MPNPLGQRTPGHAEAVPKSSAQNGSLLPDGFPPPQ
jgi:hypothetical protein